MRISRTVAYAIQAVLQLARDGGEMPVPCSRLAAEGKMPERFLLQILRTLVSHGILSSTRGVDGGYRLEMPVEEISLLQIIEAIDGPLVSHAPLGDGLYPEARAKIESTLATVTQTARRELDAVRMADLLPPRT